MTCQLGIIAPYDLSEYLTFSNIETESTPAAFDKLVSLIKNSLVTDSGAVWRWLGDENYMADNSVNELPPPSSGDAGSPYWAPLSSTISGRTALRPWRSYYTFIEDEVTYNYTYAVGVGYTYFRYRSKVPNNRNNALPVGNNDNNEWEFLDNIRDNYIYMPLHDTSQPWEVGSVVWVSSYTGTYEHYKYTRGRAWLAIDDVPAAGNPTPAASTVTPTLISTNDDLTTNNLWEFVRLTQPLRIFDVSPFTQAEQPLSIRLGLSINKPLTDAFFLNVDADNIEYIIEDEIENVEVHNSTFEMKKPITRLWEFRQPRVQQDTRAISDLPFYPRTRHTITINKSDVAKLGSLIIGQRFDVGEMQFGSSTGASALGGIERDNFETLGLKRGRAIDNMDYLIHVDREKYNSVYEYLKSIKGNIVYIVAPDIVEESGGLGYLKDFKFTVSQPEYYVLTIHLEGITDYESQN